MKRSEMVKFLAENLSELESIKTGFKGRADILLKNLEHAGMVPPELVKESWQTLPSGEMVYAVHRWEEE